MIRQAVRDSILYGAAALLTRGTAIITIPVYTRVLSPSGYGVFDLLVTAGVIVNLVVPMEIGQGLARHFADMEEGQRPVLTGTAWWFCVLTYGVFLCVTLSFAAPLTTVVFNDASLSNAFRWGVAFISANGLFFFLLDRLRWELRSLAYASVSVTYSLLVVGLGAGLAYGTDLGLVGILMGQGAAALTGVLWMLWLLRGHIGWRVQPNLLRAMLAFSVPLVPGSVAIFISLYMNRVALTRYGTFEDVGVFGIATRIATASILLVVGAQGALMPLIYREHMKPDTPRKIALLFGYVVSFALFCCLALGTFAKEIIDAFSTKEYLPAAPLIGVLAPAALAAQLYVFAPGIALAKRTGLQALISIAAATVSVLGNLALVPKWGVLGAAAATAIATMVFLAAWFVASQRYYRVHYPWRQIAALLAAYVVCSLLNQGIARTFQGWDSVIARSMMLLSFVFVMMTVKLIPWRETLRLRRTSFLEGPSEG